ncbi:MAG: plastocyanin/azurin family copper-binding protein [Dehalococcoidia bacterium]
MVPFWAGVIAGAIWFVFSLRRRGSGRDALEILRARLASGEIGGDEFREREAALKRRTGARALPARGLIVAGAVAIAVLVVIPAIVMAANGWDMWDMHGRGRNTSDAPAVQGGSQANVRIENFSFEPGNVEVPAGAAVTWTNEDSAPHDATARNGDWETERLSEGQSDTLTFDSSGEYDYYCSIHPSMKARLVVR